MTMNERIEVALHMNDAEMAEEIEWFDAARKAGTLKKELLEDLDALDAAEALADSLPK